VSCMQEARPGGRQVPVTTQVTARHSVLVLPLAAVLAVLTALLAAASVPLYAMTHQNWLVNGIGNIVVAVLFAVVGFIIVRRQPRNAIGWILLIAPAGSQLLPADAASYALLAYRLGRRLPFGAVALLLEYSWAVAALLVLLIILLFPDGHVPSPRWRPVLWSYLALVALLAGSVYAVAIATLAGHHAHVDPGGGLMAIDRPGGGTAWLGTFQPLTFVVLAAFWVSFVAVQARSWRHASGERRQQLKWLMTGAAALAVSQAVVQPILNFVPNLSSGLQLGLNVLLALGAAAVPICIGCTTLTGSSPGPWRTQS